MTIVQKHNFGAGPCILPGSVLEQAGQSVKCWDKAGLSILEVSHRSPEFEMVVKETQDLVRELLEVPEDYSIMFFQGGASMQFCMIAMNFLQGHKYGAAYLDGGVFGQKAIKEAQLFGKVHIVASAGDKGYTYMPKNYQIPEGAAYFHCTSNNTIEGTGMFSFPDTSVPMICDMSSDIFSRKIDVSRFALIYAGAQKNMGPAGMTLVIAKNSFINKAFKAVPAILDYRTYRDHQSMYNTPPVFSIYTAMLNLLWLKKKGGVKFIQGENLAKAQLLYDEIDRNPLFYGLANVADRSLMNVTFRMHIREQEDGFSKFAKSRGMIGINGYRTVGGFRASLYNALPYSSVSALVHCMQEYEVSMYHGHSFKATIA